MEPEGFIEDGERVLVLLRNWAIEVDQPGGHLWTMRDGRALRMVVYQDVRGIGGDRRPVVGVPARL